MFGLLKSNRHHVLVANESELIFADIRRAGSNSSQLEILGRCDRAPQDKLDIGLLVGGTGRKKAKIALVLPLQEFEMVTVTVPAVSREAVTKMLPYSLAKVLDRSITDYIYDWQIVQSFKDRFELTVFLYPAAKFEEYRRDLLMRQKEIAWFEPDVFAACAYLTSQDKSISETTFLCLLVWKNSVSMAVYENQRISLIRTVELELPAGEPKETLVAGGTNEELESGGLESEDESTLPEATVGSEETDGEIDVTGFFGTELSVPNEEDTVEAIEPIATLHEEAPIVLEERDSTDILAGFGLEDFQGPTLDLQTEQPSKKEPIIEEERGFEANLWDEYFENLNLEIMRTSDYHSSVLKGKSIQKVFVGGSASFAETFLLMAEKNPNMDFEGFPAVDENTNCSTTLAAIAIGALRR